MSRDRLARAGSRYATVEPVPSPTVMPFSTRSAAASAATCFSRSTLMTVCLRVLIVAGTTVRSPCPTDVTGCRHFQRRPALSDDGRTPHGVLCEL